VELGGERVKIEEIARELGFPVMIKAAMGGGGIGMKRVEKEDEIRSAWEEAKNRALQAFGDGRVYIEKYIAEPHHVEIQILGDKYGKAIYLGERECSVQRRHQKVIEEAPSPTITDETRNKMGKVSVLGAQAIRYDNAGTMEFLVDNHQNFYFLEMNTRIQVEHPVTEAITGLDLVELQIRIAMGEELPLKQEDIRTKGHAIEARIYAENPKNFYPSPGKITRLSFPELPNLRLDQGYQEGDTVTPFYDPMIAKMIAYGENRDRAIQLLRDALSQTVIEGIKTNIPFILEVLETPDFRMGTYTTHLVHKLRP
jgi:acetyl-CoA carboxylase biotin carboxylase subunit